MGMCSGDLGGGGIQAEGTASANVLGQAHLRTSVWKRRGRVDQGHSQNAQRSGVTVFASTGETGVFLPHRLLN